MVVETDDELLLNLFQNKKTRNEGFKAILSKYNQRIYYFLRKMGLNHEDADEILQDVFVLLWRDLKNGHGLDSVNLKLYQHAIKKALNFLDKNNDIPLHDSHVKDQLVLVLKNHEGFDFWDISEMLGWNINDVRNNFKSALK